MFCAFWLGNVLRATTACTFSTSQLPKVVRQWCALYILTSKCASRHNGVHFFDMNLVRKLCKHWCDSHQDTLGPHIYSFAGKNSRVALKKRRHGLVSPWLAKRQRAKKGPATGCTAWTCARNANRRLISPNIALQRDSLRESKGTGGSAQRVVEEVKVQGAFSRWGGG